MRFLFCGLIFLWGLGVSPVARAEDGCSGPVYQYPNCAANGVSPVMCAQEKCHDVSFNQDGTLFQCCPPTAVPEFPEWVNPFHLALLLSVGFLLWSSRRQPGFIRQRS